VPPPGSTRNLPSPRLGKRPGRRRAAGPFKIAMLARSVMLALALALAGCAATPRQLAVGPFDELTVAEAQRREAAGARVRWGGVIVGVTPRKEDTCIEVGSRRLDRQGRPQRGDESEGRFLACAPGFYDPAVYAKGRALTVVGTLRESVVRKIGEYDYTYPVVAAEQVHLWPKRPRVQPSYLYYDPFWGPYWPYRVYPYPYGRVVW
jgi:outer membrane lipoprotein